jgi:hypothetical protein
MSQTHAARMVNCEQYVRGHYGKRIRPRLSAQLSSEVAAAPCYKDTTNICWDRLRH